MKYITLLFLAVLVVTACAPLPREGSSGKGRSALENAQDLARRGDWEQAVMYVQTALGKDEADAAAWSLFGEARLALGDTVEAISHFEKADSLNPKIPAAVLELTFFYLRHNRLADAERVVSMAEKADPKREIAEIEVARGVILAQQGDFPGAQRILVNATTKYPETPLYPKILARLYNNSGVKERAEIYYAQAWNLAPGDLAIAYEYALLLQDIRKYDEALGLFKVVQQKDPENQRVDYMIGRLYYASGNWEEAATQFQKAATKRPNHFLSQYLLGKAVFEYSKKEKRNLYGEAEAALRKARALKPNNTDVALVLADVLNMEGRLAYQKAVTDTVQTTSVALCDSSLRLLRESFALNPALKGVHNYMARVWQKLGNPDSTIQYLKLQMVESPTDTLVLLKLVNIQQRQKDFNGLVETLSPQFKQQDWTFRKPAGDSTLYPQDKFIRKFGSIFTSALMEAGQDSAAKLVIDTVLAYEPRWKDGYTLPAYAKIAKNNYGAAVPMLQAAVKALPDDAELWLLLGDCRYFANPKSRDAIKKAKEAYLKASQLGNMDARKKFDALAVIK